jgi:hypothetical protein
MTRRLTALALTLGLTLPLTTGCLGGNALTGVVRNFNLAVAKGKWPREGVFLLLNVIPVYPIAAGIDLLIINSIEFHSGTNPISGKPRVARVGESRRVAAADGSVVQSTLREDGSIDFAITDPAGVTHRVNLGERGDRLVARDASGRELASIASGFEGR